MKFCNFTLKERFIISFVQLTKVVGPLFFILIDKLTSKQNISKHTGWCKQIFMDFNKYFIWSLDQILQSPEGVSPKQICSPVFDSPFSLQALSFTTHRPSYFWLESNEAFSVTISVFRTSRNYFWFWQTRFSHRLNVSFWSSSGTKASHTMSYSRLCTTIRLRTLNAWLLGTQIFIKEISQNILCISIKRVLRLETNNSEQNKATGDLFLLRKTNQITTVNSTGNTGCTRKKSYQKT